jgi:hypothetical protein
MTDRNDLFEDMAIALESWIKSSSESITDENADLIWTDSEDSFKSLQEVLLGNGVDKADVEQVFSECLRGLAVSFLTILDGGTALAEKGRVYLVDENGNRLGEGLHDEFVSYLLETDRLK